MKEEINGLYQKLREINEPINRDVEPLQQNTYGEIPHNQQDLASWKEKFFKQSNYLSEAIFEQPFKELELKILALISQYINQHNSLPIDEEEKLVKVIITKEEFCKSLNMDPQYFYYMAKSIAPDFHKKSVFIELLQPNKINKTKKKFHSICLVPRISCEDNQIIFYISPILQPYLEKLKVEYTILSLEYISKMGSSYAIKIYQLLAQYQKIGKRTFGVGELKKILGIPQKYREFRRFRVEVIETAIRHINENSNLKIDYTVGIIGQKAGSITFKIDVQETHFQQAIEIFQREIDLIVKVERLYQYTGEHHIIQKNWDNSKKNIAKNEELFEAWKSARIASYKAESTEKLSLHQTIDPNTGQSEIPAWYSEFLRERQRVRYGLSS